MVKRLERSPVQEIVPEILDGGFDLALGLGTIGITQANHDAIILCKVPELQI